MKNRKSLGQHWLQDRQILDQIAILAAASQPTTQLALEIGPGLGTLTSSLFKYFPQVIAVEIDQRLARNLPQSFPGKQLTVINADILSIEDISSLLPPDTRSYTVAANIPYYITSPIITKLLTAQPSPQRIVLLIQKEVAVRIAAAQGKHSYLSLFVQNRAAVTLGPVVPRTKFTPPPAVDSQVIVLDPLAQPQVDATVLSLIKLGFSSPRKKLLANLSAGLRQSRDLLSISFSSAHIDPDSRPASLALLDWQRLSQALRKALA